MERLASSSSLIRAMFEEGKRLSEKYGKANVFDYSLGNPSTKTPEAIRNRIIDVLNSLPENEVHGYMPNSGFCSTRKAVAKNLADRFGIDYTENNIIMTVGAAGGINCVLQTLLNPDDEVIVVAPFFTEYGNYIENWQGRMIIVDSEIPSFSLPVGKIKSAITKKTKAIIINNPNNPTGIVYSSQEIEALSKILVEKEKKSGSEIYIISDEPYREIVYDGIEVPFIPNYYNNTIVVYSWSKSLSLPGERIGYIAITPTANDSSLLFSACSVSNRIIGFVNAPSLIQLTVESCLAEQTDINQYDSNRKFLVENLKRIGYDFVLPKGAFYLWLKAPCDEMDFVNYAKKYNLLLVPGTAFYGKGYVRLAYCVDFDMIKRSIPAFEKLWWDANRGR